MIVLGTVLTRNAIKFSLTAVGIFLIGSLPYLIFDMKGQVTVWRLVNDGSLINASFLVDHLGFHVSGYITHTWRMVVQLFHLNGYQYFNDNGSLVFLFPDFLKAYGQSIFYLLSAILIALLAGVLITYILMLIPSKWRRPFYYLLFILESLPDIFIIIFLQWFILWYHEKTGVLLMNIMSIFGDAYALPIICLSILPTFHVIKYLLITFEQEEEHLYVELAKGKGLKRSWILLVHISRNALLTLFNHFKTIFWFSLSNLLALDIVFHNDDGFMSFLLKNGPMNPFVVTLGLLMVFVPFYVLLTAGELTIQRFTNSRRGA
jgi:ABC-type dipeptide/oligopeptide/nickel transport system permease component